MRTVRGVDASGTISTGGTAQNLTWAGATGSGVGAVPPNGFAIYNPSASADLWISLNGSAAAANASGSIRVAANGGSYECPPGFKPSQPISIFGANTSQPFTAIVW